MQKESCKGVFTRRQVHDDARYEYRSTNYWNSGGAPRCAYFFAPLLLIYFAWCCSDIFAKIFALIPWTDYVFAQGPTDVKLCIRSCQL